MWAPSQHLVCESAEKSFFWTQTFCVWQGQSCSWCLAKPELRGDKRVSLPSYCPGRWRFYSHILQEERLELLPLTRSCSLSSCQDGAVGGRFLHNCCSWRSSALSICAQDWGRTHWRVLQVSLHDAVSSSSFITILEFKSNCFFDSE